MTTDAAPAAPSAPTGPLRTLDAAQIQKAIPHRYPFLLVDRVEVLEDDKRAVGTKCVTINEEFFQGHFPGHPIMPGVLIVEALAQTACVMLLSKGAVAGKIAYFAGIEEAKFRNPVRPGDVLKLHVEVTRLGARFGKFRGEARVGEQTACEAVMSFALVEKS
jgi:3-hydroxyacyl-[acyl-carrier-protein] dehydratase